MPRATNNVAAHRRRTKVLRRARGYYGGRSRLYRTAVEAVRRAGTYSYAHRRLKKREFRSLWIARINAAAREHGMSYSEFVHRLKEADVLLDRKALAHLAVSDKQAFESLVRMVKG
jgi:large subunit ribosomal protein L20